jgi:hypothetical protein
MSAARRADLAYTAGVIVGVAFLVVSGAVAVHDRGAGLTNDFGGIWAGARAIVDGHDPYDPATWRAIAATYGTQVPDTDVYGYPRWVALALVPLALLPIDAAATLWLWGGIALAVLGTRALLRGAVPGIPLGHAVVGGTLFVAQPGYQTVANGQWTFILLAGSSAALVLVRRSRPRAAALAALVWLAKPHLFVGYALGGARWDRRFALWAAALTAAAVLAATVTAPGWVAAWSARVAPVRVQAPATLYAAARDIFGPAGLIAAALLVVIAVAVCLRAPARSDASLALWSSLSLAAAPYGWSYDQLLLLPPVILAAGVVARHDGWRATVVIVLFCIAFVLATPAVYGMALARGRETFSVVLPLATFAMVGILLWRERAGPSARTRVTGPGSA